LLVYTRLSVMRFLLRHAREPLYYRRNRRPRRKSAVILRLRLCRRSLSKYTAETKAKTSFCGQDLMNSALACSNSSNMSDMTESSSFSSQLILISGCSTVLLASALAYVLLETNKKKHLTANNDIEQIPTSPEKLVIDRSEFPGGQISVYYATQTGTSESFARQLEREGPSHGFYVHVVDLEDIGVEDVVDEIQKDQESGISRAVFLGATYGEGEAPDNATQFVAALAKKAATEMLFQNLKVEELSVPDRCLVGLDFCVFGLGNKQYDHYNATGKFLDHALERVGGNRILGLGMGDDDGDLEGDFETWKDKKLWPTMERLYVFDKEALGKRKREAALRVELPDCQYEVHYIDNGDSDFKPMPFDQVHGSSRHYFTAVDCPVTKVQELRSSEEPGSTVHVEIDISSARGLTYATADNLGVLPVNAADTVEAVARALCYDLNAVFYVKAAPNHEWHGAPFPMPLSIRECLTRYCDLTSAPRRSDLKLLASYAKDPMDQKALLRMSSKEGRTEYKEKVLASFVGIVDLLKLCPSIEIPLAHFLAVCPLLQTRFFTISSSASVYPNSIHLTVAVTDALRSDGTMFKGVCSNYLASRVPGKDVIRVYSRPSTFRLPQDSSKPILLIGPGTGVAPMRALLQERAYQREHLHQCVGQNILYFGCKKRSYDFLYQEEMERFHCEKIIDKLYLAFSRDGDQKIYVQHLLEQNSEETWRLIHFEGAYVFVCGGVKMGHDVAETLKKIAVSQGSMSLEGAKSYMTNLAKESRYVQELWA
jgi:NADPH-ferrihemoprotein reductase